MSYHGDIRLGDTIDVKFTSRAFASGAPTTLAGTPSVAAYPANSTTEITAGITLSVDFDSRTGLNNVRVVASSGNGYATATNYELVITAGTVGGTSVVGEVVGSFSIENRSALMPTTVARTLVVDASGLADANMVKAGPTGSGTAQTAGDIPARLPAALTANGNIKASLVEILTTALTETAGQLAGGFKKFFNIATPAATMDHLVLVDTATNLTNAPTAGDFTATMKTSIGTAVAASAVASVTAGVTIAAGAITDAAIAAGSGLKAIRSNTAQAGAGTTITLDVGASASNNFYNNTLILLTGGTGAGQARFITAYVGASKVATVATWTTNPDNTTTFVILPFDAVAGASAPTAAQNATAVWTDLLAGSDFSTASSIGKLLKDDIDAAISSRLASGSYTAPDNASITAIKTITDQIRFTVANKVDSTIQLASDFAQGAADKVWSTVARTLTAFGFNVTVGTNNDKTGYGLSAGERNSIADAYLDRADAVETGITPRQAARLGVAADSGKVDGMGTTTVHVRDAADTKNRVTATVDSVGNRTDITRDLT